jgi:hypothetical protein
LIAAKGGQSAKTFSPNGAQTPVGAGVSNSGDKPNEKREGRTSHYGKSVLQRSRNGATGFRWLNPWDTGRAILLVKTVNGCGWKMTFT